ncbi:DNA ligase D [Cognatiluteimonas telluris]|uniref:DNA ligase D n=1 Tax=Cognatiluteimonas telluris TaxID=1104775 RepID=UPI00140BAA93|nr:DNA ligase D [Lysobacter telluris]
MSLVEYQRKRQFNKTREPAPGKPLPEGKRAIFVVQLHHASRRHYDFRLQVGDALKSWAVPKGPSYDPSVKRMAVEVEDHPISYANFEGEIPKGQYGGGHVALFDTGVWSTPHDAEAQLAKGHLRFELFGDKLKGGWHLVRSGKPAKQPQWLLFKEDDQYAGDLEADDLLADVTAPPEADAKRAGRGKANKKKQATVAPKRRPRRIDWAKKAAKLTGARKKALKNEAFEPQLARLGDHPPEGPQWLHEIKWDGYRLVTTIVDGVARIWSRNAIEWTAKVPEIAAAITQLGLKAGALDGELIAGTGTQQDFNLLQATLSGEQQGTLVYVLFDLLHVDGIAIDNAPLVERKQLLAELLDDPPRHLALSTHIEADGDAAYKLASEQKFEGIISKRGDRPYMSGRGDDWRKTKHLQTEEFAVVGYTPGKGNRGGFGSLLLARPDPVHGWSYAGRIGSGFNNEQIRKLTRRIGKAGRTEPTVHVTEAVRKDIRGALWFDPMFVVEVFLRGTGGSGVLRQASLKAVRPDKDVGSLADTDRVAGGTGTPPRTGRSTARKATTARSPGAVSRGRGEGASTPVRITSPGKIIFPDSNITKQQVADYYLAVMDHLLPGVAGRPLSIIRCPEGAGKPCFFQKHHTPGLEHVSLVRLKEEAGNNASYLVAYDAAGIMELVQLNGLEFHPWGSHADDPDVADRVVFDLDPGPNVPWSEVKKSAEHVRGLLRQAGLKSFLRTTGGKGLHVVVPLNPGCHWDIVRNFARGFAEALARAEPQRYLAVSTIKLRPNKIFVDYLRNGRGATAVASYSLRARDRAPVAMPIAWSQLAALKRGDAFTLKDVPALLKRRKRDPWAGIDDVGQDLSRWAGG